MRGVEHRKARGRVCRGAAGRPCCGLLSPAGDDVAVEGAQLDLVGAQTHQVVQHLAGIGQIDRVSVREPGSGLQADGVEMDQKRCSGASMG